MRGSADDADDTDEFVDRSVVQLAWALSYLRHLCHLWMIPPDDCEGSADDRMNSCKAPRCAGPCATSVL